MKLKIHPLFIVLSIVMLFFRQGVVMIFSVVAVILHEYGHYVAGKYYGYMMNKVELLPYGAVLCGKENIDKKAERIIALTGPLVNVFLALLTVSIWWIFPKTYYFTNQFCTINIGLALINLMPVFPLDGARIVLSLSKNRLKALKILRINGIAVAMIFLILFVVSAFFEINFTLGIFAVFLFIGATNGTDNENYSYVFNNALTVKNLDNGVTLRQIYITKDITLLKTLKLTSPSYYTEFVVVDKNFYTITKISENTLIELYQKYPLHTKLCDTKIC